MRESLASFDPSDINVSMIWQQKYKKPWTYGHISKHISRNNKEARPRLHHPKLKPKLQLNFLGVWMWSRVVEDC